MVHFMAWLVLGVCSRINYEYFRRFGVMNVFLDVFRSELEQVRSQSSSSSGAGVKKVNEKKLCFSVAGICNLCLDAKNNQFLLDNHILSLVNQLIECFINNSISNTEILLNLLELVLFLTPATTTATTGTTKTDGNRCHHHVLKQSLRALFAKQHQQQVLDKRLRNMIDLINQDLLSDRVSNLE